MIALSVVLGASVLAIYHADITQERRMGLLALVAAELGLVELAAMLGGDSCESRRPPRRGCATASNSPARWSTLFKPK